MDRSVLIFFANNEKEVAINGFENKTICSGEVDGISVETEDYWEDNWANNHWCLDKWRTFWEGVNTGPNV